MLAEFNLKDVNLSGALQQLQENIRKEPANAKLRIFLFQLLAVLGQWDRALNQLNVLGQMDASTLPMVHAYRAAIQCEALRSDIFAGKRAPLVFGDPEPWMVMLIETLRLDAAGETDKAERTRAQAFEEASATKGTLNGEPFEWIADADMRLGPMLEAVINGSYYFVPFHRIKKIKIDPPSDLRDSVWMPASFMWANEGEAFGLIPTRYAGTLEKGDDAQLLSRRTDWDGNFGIGQRIFATDAGECALMDVRLIELDSTGS